MDIRNSGITEKQPGGRQAQLGPVIDRLVSDGVIRPDEAADMMALLVAVSDAPVQTGTDGRKRSTNTPPLRRRNSSILRKP